MEIKDLKIHDWLYKYHSHIQNGDKPFLDYTFFQITEETNCYWIVGYGTRKVRKTDLKIFGSTYSFEKMQLMDKEAWEMKKQKDDWRLKQNTGLGK